MAHSLSWAFTAAITRGGFEDMKKINSELFHESICPEEELRAKSYSLDDMSGTMLISLFIMLLGRLVMC